MEHVSTNSMVAYPLTKGLLPKVFHKHVTHIGCYLMMCINSGSLLFDVHLFETHLCFIFYIIKFDGLFVETLK